MQPENAHKTEEDVESPESNADVSIKESTNVLVTLAIAAFRSMKAPR